MTNVYKAVRGSNINDEQASVYGAQIAILAEANDGAVSAEIIVDEAIKQSSPLHGYFEWDDHKAAFHYRIDQAQYLLRSINIVIVNEGKEGTIRAFHNVVKHEQRAYVTAIEMLSDAELRQQVIEQAFQELEHWKKKYRYLNELAQIFKALEKVK